MPSDEQTHAAMFNRAIAGESLTNSPDAGAPWEQPPKFTDVDEAIRSMMRTIGAPKNLSKIMALLQDDAPVTNVTRTLLFAGFAQGAITPDMMLLMYEPIAVFLITIARTAGIDPVLYPGEHADMTFEDEIAYFRDMDQQQLMEIMNTKSEEPGQEMMPEGEQMMEGGEAPAPDQMNLLGGPKNGY